MELVCFQRRHDAYAQAVSVTVETVNSIKIILALSLESEASQANNAVTSTLTSYYRPQALSLVPSVSPSSCGSEKPCLG